VFIVEFKTEMIEYLLFFNGELLKELPDGSQWFEWSPKPFKPRGPTMMSSKEFSFGE